MKQALESKICKITAILLRLLLLYRTWVPYQHFGSISNAQLCAITLCLKVVFSKSLLVKRPIRLQTCNLFATIFCRLNDEKEFLSKLIKHFFKILASVPDTGEFSNVHDFSSFQ